MLKETWARLQGLFGKPNSEAELDDELREHMALAQEEHVRRGMSRKAARYAALRDFGGVEQVKEIYRERRGLPMLETFLQDLRFGVRMLRKNPGFTAVAILTLALGIGANTAIFSVVEGVVLAPLPYREPDQLVMVLLSNYHAPQMDTSYPDFQDWQRNARSFQQMAAFNLQDYDLTSPGTPEHIDGVAVTANFYDTLGVNLAFGRKFSKEEDTHGGPPAVIISNRLWRNRLAGSPAAIGKTVTLDGVDSTVVGVLPPEFRFPWGHQPDVFTPIGQGPPLLINGRTVHAVTSVARLNAGVTIAQAQAEMSAVQNQLDLVYPAEDKGLGSVVTPLKQEIVGNSDRELLMLLGAAGFVLLIACANVASLVLARSAVRTREFAIRTALGAGRARILRQLVSESLILSVTGGTLGLAIAKWGVHPMLTALPGNLPRSDGIGVNAPVLLFTLGVSITVGILFGLAPVLKSSKIDLQTALKERSHGSTGARNRAQSSLVIVQMALTLVLLMGAGLLFRTIRHLWEINPGFVAQHLITFKVGLSPLAADDPAKIGVAYRQLIERLRETPGVEAADFTNIVPLSREDNGTPFWVGDQKYTSVAEAPRLLMFWTGTDYLKSMGKPLLEGRFFTPEDTVKSAKVLVIDSVMAHAYFPGKDPVGRSITINIWGVGRVIGVVGHVTHWGLDRPNIYTQNQAYGSFYQLPADVMSVFVNQTVLVRSPLSAADLMPAIRNAVYATGKDQPVFNFETIQEIVSRSMDSQRFPMILLGAFAGLALLLASVGIYGVISYSVTQRLQEIGIRMALGAQKLDVFRMVIGQGLRLALAGMAIGVAAALALTRLLSSFAHLLYGVGTTDVETYAGVTLLLALVGALACYVPARRAMRVDPVIALRYE